MEVPKGCKCFKDQGAESYRELAKMRQGQQQINNNNIEEWRLGGQAVYSSPYFLTFICNNIKLSHGSCL